MEMREEDNTDLKQPILLFISCRNLLKLDFFSQSDPQVIVKLKFSTQKKWDKHFETEKLDNNRNPEFCTPIECDYFLEKEQIIKFFVYDIDGQEKELIGKYETKLKVLFENDKPEFKVELQNDQYDKSPGTLIVKLDKVKKLKDTVQFKDISAYGLRSFKWLCCFGTDQPYMVLSRKRIFVKRDLGKMFKGGKKQSEVKFESEYLRVYSTNIATNLNPEWNDTKEIKLATLCDGDLD